MHVTVVRNPAFRTAPHSADYFVPLDQGRKGAPEFTRLFMDPMRENLRTSLRKLVAQGAGSFLEIGPGWGSGSDIAILHGFRKVSMVELNPALVSRLENKYGSAPGDSSITIYEGDARDVLPSLPSKFTDVGLIFDNTLSNMQKLKGTSGFARDDFRQSVLAELVRISRASVLVGLASVELTPVFLECFADKLRETSPDGKVSIFHNGTVSQRYDDVDVSALLSSAGVVNATIRKDCSIYWIEIKP